MAAPAFFFPSNKFSVTSSTICATPEKMSWAITKPAYSYFTFTHTSKIGGEEEMGVYLHFDRTNQLCKTIYILPRKKTLSMWKTPSQLRYRIAVSGILKKPRLFYHSQELFLFYYSDAQLLGFFKLGTGIFSCNQVIGIPGNR